MSSKLSKKVALAVDQRQVLAQRKGATSRTGATAGDAAGRDQRVIRVLCVDDHALLVEGLKAQFAIDEDIVVVGRLPTAAKLIEEVERLHPDAVLLDIEMPGPDAFETASRLKHSHPKVKTIVLSAHIRDAFITASFSAGACGYFSKSDDLDDILNGIRDAVASPPGAFVLSPKVRELCRPSASKRQGAAQEALTPAEQDSMFNNAVPPRTLLSSLTAREVEILRLIGKGLSRNQIAQQLSRSAKTVDGHQDRMMRKLGIAARADLMRFAIREGLAQA